MNWHLDLFQSWQISRKTCEVLGHELHIVASSAHLAIYMCGDILYISILYLFDMIELSFGPRQS